MLYDVNEFCIIHGDLCFANMMVDSNCSFVKVIDPRENLENMIFMGTADMN